MSLRRKSNVAVVDKPSKAVKTEETPKRSNTEATIADLVDKIGEAKAREKEAQDTIKQSRELLKDLAGDRTHFEGKIYKVDFVERDGRISLNKDLLLDNLVEAGLTKAAAQDIIKNSHKKGNPYTELVVKKR